MLLTHAHQPSHAGACAALVGSSPFAQQQHLQQPDQHSPAAASGSASPPVSSTSVGTAVMASATSAGSQATSPLAASGSSAETQYHGSSCGPQHQQHGYASIMAGSGPKRPPISRYTQDREWLYRLITFPSYFTPCPSCCTGARTPKREQLMTQFDTEYPYRVYCSHCPECKDRVNSGCLLQVRRSAFKDVVKATDIQRYGADVAGVQQYTLNGSKVIYLNREQTPEKKGNNTNAAPAACSVDGRAMMDKSSSYCSLKCKLIAEDPGFTTWLDTQDPSVRLLAQAAANAPPRPTAASKRAAQPTSSNSSGGCSPDCEISGGTSRPPKCARTLDSAAAGFRGPAGAVSLQRAATVAPHNSAAPPAGLTRLRISLPAKRQASAPGAFLEAALAEPGAAAGGGCTAAAAAAAMAASSWLDLDTAALSCVAGGWEGWDLDSSLDSPCFAAQASTKQQSLAPSAAVDAGMDEDGNRSPALINAPTVFRSGSCDDWWLCGSPLDSAFTCAGMGALLNSDASFTAGVGGAGALVLPGGGSGAASPCSYGAETSTVLHGW